MCKFAHDRKTHFKIQSSDLIGKEELILHKN